MKHFYLICLILLAFGCKKEDTPDPTIAVLATSAVTNIGGSSAVCGGNISSDGGSAITSRGVCWGLNNNPTIEDSFTSDGTSTGSFSSKITDLIQHTNYYVRAYAKNSVGIAYGSPVLFTTTSAFYEGNYLFITDTYGYSASILPGENIVFKVSQNGNEIYNCNYECKGKLISDPQNGLTVEGVWYKFFRVSGLYPSLYFVVQQKDELTLIIKSSTIGYDSAYKLGEANIYNKF